MLLNTGEGDRRRVVALVVAKEDVLEARLIAGQRDDRILSGLLDHRVCGALDRNPHGGAVAQRLALDDTFELRDGVRRYRLSKGDSDLVALDVHQFVDAAELDKAAFANDAHARARLLDLAQDVRGEKYGASFVARLFDHAVEFLLVKRVEAARWFVEDEHPWPMHEGLDEHDLALVAGRVLAKLPARVEVHPLDQLLQVGAVDPAAQVCEVLEDLPAGQAAVAGSLAGHVADEPLDLDRLCPAVQA